MKRPFTIVLIFCALFVLLCISGCGDDPYQLMCGSSGCRCGLDYLIVEAFQHEACSSGSEYISQGDVRLMGCHLDHSCIDCYYFPTACGYYENDLEASPASHVVCGWDCTFTECYGEKLTDAAPTPQVVSNKEERNVIEADEGIHYTIDSISTVLSYGETQAWLDNSIDLNDLASLISMAMMTGDAVTIHITVEYTALTELHSVAFRGDILYKGYDWTNYTNGFHVKRGNSTVVNDNEKSLNILPGKHILHVSIPLNIYETLQFDELSALEFSARTYSEEES